jgi:replicative DNA helicase
LSTEEKETFEFDAGFQSKIAALILRDAEFNRRTDSLIEPGYFEDEATACLADLGLGYFKRYKSVPDNVTMVALLRDRFASKGFREEMKEPVKKKLGELIKKTDVSNRDFVIDKVAEFARHQALTHAILTSAEELEKRNFDKIGDLVRKAMDVGAQSERKGYDFFEESENRAAERRDIISGTLKPKGITTGSTKFDKLLYHHGWGRQELSVLMGAAKAGKTTALVEFARAAALAGYNVLYCTLEVSARIIAERLDANISSLAYKELGDKLHEVKEKVEEAQKKAGALKIHEYPTGSMKASDLRRLIHRYAGEGLKFDLVVVDYGDLMAPERWTQEPRENSRMIYVDLRAISQEEDLAVLTATQTNREGAKAAVAKMTDVAEDFNKIRIADLVISINATDEEKAMGESRLFFAASRNQKGEFTVRIKQDLERGKFLRKIIGLE